MFNKKVVAGLILNAYYSNLAFKGSKGIHPIPVKEEMEKFQKAILDEVLSNWEHILNLLTDKYPPEFWEKGKEK